MTTKNIDLSIKSLIKYACLLICLVTLADALIPGKGYESVIEEISQEYQPYFNAGGNGHFAYTVITADHQFSIDANDLFSIEEGEIISYRISRIFQEIQSYTSEGGIRNRNSLSNFTGLIIPLFGIFVILISLRTPEKYGTLTFVAEVLILANLIFILQ